MQLPAFPEGNFASTIKELRNKNTTNRKNPIFMKINIALRVSKIVAKGTSQKPIIFTAEFDDVNDPSDAMHLRRKI